MNEPALAPAAAPSSLLTPLPFSAGEVIGAAFRIFFQGLAVFAPAALLILAPAILLDVFALAIGAGDRVDRLSTLVWNLSSSFVTAGITRGALDLMDGTRPGLPRMLGAAGSRGVRVFGAGILAGLVSVLGLVLFVIPGLFALAGLYLAETAAAAEPNTSSRASLGRSWSLTEGHRLGALGVYLLFQVIPLAVALATVVGLELLAGEPFGWLVSIVGYSLSGLALALRATAGAVAYHRLRGEKEGAAQPALAAVFE